MSLKTFGFAGGRADVWKPDEDELEDAFARAWFKLTHRDMGPIARYLGPLDPQETLIWQDPVPEVTHELVGAQDLATLKGQILNSGLPVSQLVSTAWASASTFRGSDKRGGANGARIRLEPQRGWEVNDPDTLATVLRTLEGIQEAFNSSQTGGKKISLADLIVLGGCAAVEQAAKNAGLDVGVPFTPGRTDASQEQTDVESFSPLEPAADGFRNYRGKGSPTAAGVPPDRPREPADPERARDDRPRRWPASPGREPPAVPAGRPHLDARIADQRLLREPARHGHEWTATAGSDSDAETFEGRDLATGEVKWTGSRVDLVFGSNSELRALTEVYASDDSREKFVRDFVAAWNKVMNLDRFDLA